MQDQIDMNETARLGRNFGATAFSQLYSQILTLIVSLVLARNLGAEQYGIFAFGFAFPSWFVLFVSLGLGSVLTIEIAADRSRAGSYLTTVALLRLPLALAAIVALWISTQLIFPEPFERNITMMLGTASILVAYAGTFLSIFMGFERFEFSALVTVIERTLTTVAILLLVWSGFGLFEASSVFVIASGLTLVLSMLIVRMRFVSFQRKVDLDLASRILKKAIPFALAAVPSTLLYSTGAVLLTILRDSTATGLFNAAFALTLALLAPLPIYYSVILPTMSRMYREAPEMLSVILHKSQKLFFVVGLPAALGGWFYAEGIMTLFYGEAFRESAGSFGILVLVAAKSTAVVGIGSALAASNHQTYNLLIGGAGALTNVIVCLLFIPLLGHIGAAHGFLWANLVMAVLGFVAVHRLVTRIDVRKTLPKPVIAGAVMIIVLYVLPDLPLLLGIFVGAAVYFSALILARGITGEDLATVKDVLRGAFFR